MADITGAPAYIADPTGVESRFSGVSWGAIVAGGVASAAMALILMTLGAGLGLISVSPWPNEGASAEAVGIGVIVWSIVIEVAAFGLGGYLAGRLRTKWANIHGDEVYFRDTAHGFVTWALGTLVSIALVTAAAGHVARGTAEVGAAAIGGAGTAAAAAGPAMMDGANRMAGPGPRGGSPLDYYVDLMFRPAGATPPAGATSTSTDATTGATTGATTADTTTGTTPAPAPVVPMTMQPQGAGGDLNADRAQILHIAAQSFKDGTITLAPEDKTYIAQLIAQRTGLSQQEAEKRVDDTIAKAKATMDEAATKAKQAADAARKAGAGLALWSFIAMLIGAFVASYAATIGGRHRDI
ncbi:hypothetical protein [Dongia sedimenti]|uniref:Uncharacterized protein n=1 Tax=Dongia sedimenti TaxID=3064282 RepID=A0ABU0YHV4_9PROT|nr:hypothetical protein [Rhodospirillaceae bacterium R-7]